MNRVTIYIILLITVFVSCTKEKETENVSHISYLPTFRFTGGDFISVEKGTQKYYKEYGVDVYINGKKSSTPWYYLTDTSLVDMSKTGVYVIKYWAQNKEYMSKIGQRIVAVTDGSIKNNDLSGTYYNDMWGYEEMKVRALNDKGYYEASEILGHPAYSMSGNLVDIGKGNVVLLQGEGSLGRYAMTEGDYTSNVLSLDLYFLDPPVEDLTLNIVWKKVK